VPSSLSRPTGPAGKSLSSHSSNECNVREPLFARAAIIGDNVSATDYVIAGATVATALFLGAGLYYQMRDRLPKVYLEQIDEPPPLRPDGTRVIRVRSDSLIEKCRLFYAGKEMVTMLPGGPGGRTARVTTLYPGAVLNYRIPQALSLHDDDHVEVKDGNKTLRKERLGNIQMDSR
jgi:hypothetical protein